jgi:hypothetical protein
VAISSSNTVSAVLGNRAAHPVADGQTLDKIDFTLPRMSGIAGRITDENGEPIEGVSVYAARSLFFEGRRRLVPVSGSSVRTDDEGEYRLLRLPPGSYHVMASTKETWTVVEGGREIVLGYMPTYFPGVAASSDARRVTLGIGEQVRTIDFLDPDVPRISGTAVDSRAGRSRVSLSEEVRGSRPLVPVPMSPRPTAFTAVNVPPKYAAGGLPDRRKVHLKWR